MALQMDHMAFLMKRTPIDQGSLHLLRHRRRHRKILHIAIR